MENIPNVDIPSGCREILGFAEILIETDDTHTPASLPDEDDVEHAGYCNPMPDLCSTDIPVTKTFQDVQQFNQSLNNLFRGTFRPANPLEILSINSCCIRKCTLLLSRFVIERLRCSLPLEKLQLRDYQFHLVREMYKNGLFEFKAGGERVCENVFAAIYVIPASRLKKIKQQLQDDYTQPDAHGNDGRKWKSNEYYTNVARMVVLLEDVAQDSPTDGSYYMPRGLSKIDFMKEVNPETQKQLLPDYYLQAIKPTLHWHSRNALTNRCTSTQHRMNHFDNIISDRLDYEVRKMFSVRNPLSLICITHDAMSKNKSRLPHLNTNRSKVLSDCDLAYCTLSGLIVHRISKL
uniref:Uncharacterized protein n=1 Tax=Panagrolaimus sp. PS1159 TaxID=55785 RepID=A0AC35G1K0_9BILA